MARLDYVTFSLAQKGVLSRQVRGIECSCGHPESESIGGHFVHVFHVLS